MIIYTTCFFFFFMWTMTVLLRRRNSISEVTKCSTKGGQVSNQMTDSNKDLACWANPCATLLSHIRLQILAREVIDPVRELWTTMESPSKIAELKPWSQAKRIPSSIALASISKEPKGAWIFMLSAARTNLRWSLITTPTPAAHCLSKTAPSTLTLSHGCWGKTHLTLTSGVLILIQWFATWNSSKNPNIQPTILEADLWGPFYPNLISIGLNAPSHRK